MINSNAYNIKQIEHLFCLAYLLHKDAPLLQRIYLHQEKK